jgi:hypothetical protein
VDVGAHVTAMTQVLYEYCKSENDDDVLSFWQSGQDGDVLFWRICCLKLRNFIKLYVMQWNGKWRSF